MVDNRFYRDGKFNDDRWITAAKWNDLVYVRTLKCGSEFFYRNFTQTAGWTPITWSDIDWSSDKVFSYVMDPIQRRHKGVAEFLFATEAHGLFLKDPVFQRTIAQVPCLDEHSACLRDIYGHRLHDIWWIPLSQHDHDQGRKLTDRWLQENGHPSIAWDQEFTHTTENYIGELYRAIKLLWEEQAYISDFVRFYFKEDIELYESAQQKHGLIS